MKPNNSINSDQSTGIDAEHNLKLINYKKFLISLLKENEKIKMLNIALTVVALVCTVWLVSPSAILSLGLFIPTLLVVCTSILTIIFQSALQSVNTEFINKNDYLKNQKEIYLNKIADFLVSQDDIFLTEGTTNLIIPLQYALHTQTDINFKEEDVKKLIGPLQRYEKKLKDYEKKLKDTKSDLKDFLIQELKKSHVINDVIQNIIAREVIKEPGLFLGSN